LMELVAKELRKRKNDGTFTAKFNALSHFFGYEGRAGFPSNFDAQYCYALGYVASLLIKNEESGYICALTGLNRNVEEWEPLGIPLVSMMDLETRHGKVKPVIKKALVELKGRAFAYFARERGFWRDDDPYLFPGPIQFFGDKELTDSIPLSIKKNKQ
jgi:diphosphate-dependent phosphofructokinase